MFSRPVALLSLLADKALPKLFIAALQADEITGLERERIDGKFLSNLRFADDIVLFSMNMTEVETIMKTKRSKEREGVRINRQKNQFMKDAFCEDQEMELEGCPIAEMSFYISDV
ncbi:unnamed protein product [Strongylus vulgaris]|uniref:Reverse transcriptase domain-containing protein n=1 Tax=Strongylus vulgaris TaxID=40348 RepID=A0A3P7JDH5_STRVU|nr:unnamed protein product [Strongylus vulgaris]